MIDTNAINARQKIDALNQMEKWRADGVIMLLMPEPAYVEAQAGANAERSAKAETQLRTNSSRISPEQHQRFSGIEKAVFPNGVTMDSERNDVEIVYQAADWGYVLVTNDGDSKTQPRGILGARRELAELGVSVMRPEEAMEYVRQRIRNRDERLTSNCAATGTPEPAWLWND